MTQNQKSAVLEALKKSAPRSLHLMELADLVGANRRKLDKLEQTLASLVSLGKITEAPGRRYRLASQRKKPAQKAYKAPKLDLSDNRIERGRLQVHPRGFAFVTPESGAEDVFIPPDGINAAMHGDLVEIQARPSRKGREGRVLHVLGRGPGMFSGVLIQKGKKRWLQPDDPRLPDRIDLLGKVESRRKDIAVRAEFVRFPQYDGDIPAARVVEILGKQGLTDVEVRKIKIREGVVEEFPEAALEEAKQLPNEVPQRDFVGREDLRDVDLVTIDPADARDHDDALWCERTSDGYRLIVAIADVSHYVREGTAIDEEAISRMTSIYLPDRAIPMLPKEISSGLASLVPDEDRLCMAVEIDLSRTGAVKRYRLMEAVMRSRARVTYEGAARALGLSEDGPNEPEAEKRKAGLEALYELSKTLRKKRLKRGALDFDFPEPKVILDDKNIEPIDVRRSRKDPGVREAYRIVEEMMLLANETVAGELKRLKVPAIHRLHGKPDPQKVAQFAKLAGVLAHKITLDEAREPKSLSKFLEKIEGTDHDEVLRYLLLRSMQQAQYGVDEKVGHFGLAAKDYLHFTSPIRRYPDLVVHRVLKAVLRNEHVDGAVLMPKLHRFSAEASRLERRAMMVERDVVDLYRAILLKDRVGDEFDGEISGVNDRGIYVRLDDPFADVFIPIDRLDNDYFEVGELGIRLIGARSGKIYGLGDDTTVRIEHIDISEGKVQGVIVSHEHTGPKTSTRGQRRRTRQSNQREVKTKKARSSKRGKAQTSTSHRRTRPSKDNKRTQRKRKKR